MACAGYMMTLELVSGRVNRRWSGSILALALGYVLANVGRYLMARPFLVNPLQIFEPLFIFSVVLIGPLAAIFGVAALIFLNPNLRARPPWMALAGLVLWMACVGALNLFAIGMVAASV